MCGRFININNIDRIKKSFSINNTKKINNYSSYNISPNQSSLMISNSNKLMIELANWGFKFFDKISNLEKNIFNSRVETIKNKILFKESYEKRKCVIPTNGYFEWKFHNNEKFPFFIHLENLECFYFAGIWKYVNFKKNYDKFFSIITKKPCTNLSNLHHRMPILLSYNEAIDFLEDKEGDFIDSNFKSILEKNIIYYKVSKFVNNPINNTKECIKEIN